MSFLCYVCATRSRYISSLLFNATFLILEYRDSNAHKLCIIQASNSIAYRQSWPQSSAEEKGSEYVFDALSIEYEERPELEF